MERQEESHLLVITGLRSKFWKVGWRGVVVGLWKEMNLGVTRREILGLEEVKAENPMVMQAFGHMPERSQTPLCSLRIMNGPGAT